MRIFYLFNIVLLCAALMTSCSKSSYIGKTYTPTTSVEIYMADSEIERAYELMGELEIEGESIVSVQKLQEKMIEEAKSKGADAVLILGLDEKVVGTSTYTRGSDRPSESGSHQYNGSSATSTQVHKVLKAKFLKYKD